MPASLKCSHCGTLTARFGFCIKCQTLCCLKCIHDESFLCRNCKPKDTPIQHKHEKETIITA